MTPWAQPEFPPGMGQEVPVTPGKAGRGGVRSCRLFLGGPRPPAPQDGEPRPCPRSPQPVPASPHSVCSEPREAGAGSSPVSCLVLGALN